MKNTIPNITIEPKVGAIIFSSSLFNPLIKKNTDNEVRKNKNKTTDNTAIPSITIPCIAVLEELFGWNLEILCHCFYGFSDYFRHFTERFSNGSGKFFCIHVLKKNVLVS
jgi:hypothetical protein